jgi:hypothetical protein
MMLSLSHHQRIPLCLTRCPGLVTHHAGKAAPLGFIAVALVLYLYRGIYAMAVLSFPQNGKSPSTPVTSQDIAISRRPVHQEGCTLSVFRTGQ